MFFVICYDITEDRRRVKVQKAMEDFGARVQYSVFECDLDDKALRRLRERLTRIIDARSDSVRFYAMCEADVRRIAVMGVGAVVRPEAFRIV
ncbi:MAG: CRISPR-associated endonuclease Cas2 [Ardenticatenales bacterium]